jgi:hypothetical protein
VTKLNSTGSALVYSTYLGGSANPDLGGRGAGIAVDPSGDVYLTGANDEVDAWTAKLALGADVVWALQTSPRTFALVGRRINSRCVAASHSNRHHPACTRPIKLRISYQLSIPAKVSFTVTRQLAGRLADGRCVKPTNKNRHHRHCTRLVPVPGTLTVNGQPGSNSFTFDGRIGGHKLTPGQYRLTATPTVNEQTGTPRTVTVTITG